MTHDAPTDPKRPTTAQFNHSTKLIRKSKKLKKLIQNILDATGVGFEPGIVHPAVHNANHSTTVAAGRVCLKYLFNVTP